MSENKSQVEQPSQEELGKDEKSFWTLFRLMALLAFLTLLAIPYIYNAHRADAKIRAEERLNNELEELRSEYITLKSEVVGQNKQSDIAKKLKIRQLEPLSEAPINLNEPSEH